MEKDELFKPSVRIYYRDSLQSNMDAIECRISVYTQNNIYQIRSLITLEYLYQVHNLTEIVPIELRLK